MSQQQQEQNTSIYSSETVYRPPTEENSALLEVALGCSWGKCTFCDFAKDRFVIHPLPKIIQNLQVLGMVCPEKTRLFLLGENAFVLSTQMLLDIIDAANTYMPEVTEFAMYARVDDVLRKSPQELRQLRERGVCDLHIGIESGSDSILAMVNKGVTSSDMLQATRRLDEAGIGYYFTVILGLGGKAYRNLHALETSRLINQTHPKEIWCLALKIWPDTPLEKQAKRGEFERMTHREMLLEERILLENLTVENCNFTDTTVLNRFTIAGRLPEQKGELLRAINLLLG